MEGGQERPLCKGDFGTDRTMQIPGRGVFQDFFQQVKKKHACHISKNCHQKQSWQGGEQ